MAVSVAGYLAFAFIGLLDATFGTGREPIGMAWCVLGFFLSLALFAAAWLIQWREDHPRPLIRLDPCEKPPGYNRAVLGWFWRGPERRQRDSDFSAGFRDRAKLPPVALAGNCPLHRDITPGCARCSERWRLERWNMQQAQGDPLTLTELPSYPAFPIT